MKKLLTLKEAQKYLTIPDEAIAFLENADDATACGRYAFGDDCYVVVMDPTTTVETGAMEAHKTYIDVQYIIKGEEKILYAPVADLEPETEYDVEKDFALYRYADCDAVDYIGGQAVILYPEDAHLACRAVGEPMQVKKAVIKVRVKA